LSFIYYYSCQRLRRIVIFYSIVWRRPTCGRAPIITDLSISLFSVDHFEYIVCPHFIKIIFVLLLVTLILIVWHKYILYVVCVSFSLFIQFIPSFFTGLSSVCSNAKSNHAWPGCVWVNHRGHTHAHTRPTASCAARTHTYDIDSLLMFQFSTFLVKKYVFK